MKKYTETQLNTVTTVMCEVASHQEWEFYVDDISKKLDGQSGVIDYIMVSGLLLDSEIQRYLANCSSDAEDNFDQTSVIQDYAHRLLECEWLAESERTFLARTIIEG